MGYGVFDESCQSGLIGPCQTPLRFFRKMPSSKHFVKQCRYPQTHSITISPHVCRQDSIKYKVKKAVKGAESKQDIAHPDLCAVIKNKTTSVKQNGERLPS